MMAAALKTIISNIEDPELREYVKRCAALIPPDDVLGRTKQVPTGISQSSFIAACQRLAVNTTLFRITDTEYTNRNEAHGIRCGGVGPLKRNLKTVFPSEDDAKNPNLACMYCTYLQIFGKPDYDANKTAIDICVSSLQDVRREIAGGQKKTKRPKPSAESDKLEEVLGEFDVSPNQPTDTGAGQQTQGTTGGAHDMTNLFPEEVPSVATNQSIAQRTPAADQNTVPQTPGWEAVAAHAAGQTYPNNTASDAGAEEQQDGASSGDFDFDVMVNLLAGTTPDHRNDVIETLEEIAEGFGLSRPSSPNP